jgi:hypothetical protein
MPLRSTQHQLPASLLSPPSQQQVLQLLLRQHPMDAVLLLQQLQKLVRPLAAGCCC